MTVRMIQRKDEGRTENETETGSSESEAYKGTESEAGEKLRQAKRLRRKQ